MKIYKYNYYTGGSGGIATLINTQKDYTKEEFLELCTELFAQFEYSAEITSKKYPVGHTWRNRLRIEHYSDRVLFNLYSYGFRKLENVADVIDVYTTSIVQDMTFEKAKRIVRRKKLNRILK